MKANATNQVTTESIVLECRGCSSIDNVWGEQTCRVRNIMLICLPKRLCPCQICIVKTMCNDLCEEYAKYAQYLKRRAKRIQKGAKIDWGKGDII